jgi:hypothetical protein
VPPAASGCALGVRGRELVAEHRPEHSDAVAVAGERVGFFDDPGVPAEMDARDEVIRAIRSEG